MRQPVQRGFVQRGSGSRGLTPAAVAIVVASVVVLLGAGFSVGVEGVGGLDGGLPLVVLDEPATDQVQEGGAGDGAGLVEASSVIHLVEPVSGGPVSGGAEPVAAQVPESGAAVAGDDSVSDAVPMFNGRPLRKARTLRMKVTAYSPDARSCGKWADGRTASGMSVWTNGMKLVAADTSILPFRSIISVPGYHGGRPVPVLDRGGAIRGHRLDVLYPTHEMALGWGVRDLEVTVWEYADR